MKDNGDSGRFMRFMLLGAVICAIALLGWIGWGLFGPGDNTELALTKGQAAKTVRHPVTQKQSSNDQNEVSTHNAELVLTGAIFDSRFDEEAAKTEPEIVNPGTASTASEKTNQTIRGQSAKQ